MSCCRAVVDDVGDHALPEQSVLWSPGELCWVPPNTAARYQIHTHMAHHYSAAQLLLIGLRVIVRRYWDKVRAAVRRSTPNDWKTARSRLMTERMSLPFDTVGHCYLHATFQRTLPTVCSAVAFYQHSLEIGRQPLNLFPSAPYGARLLITRKKWFRIKQLGIRRYIGNRP